MTFFYTFIIFQNGYVFAVITNERGIQCQKMNNTGKKPEVCYL